MGLVLQEQELMRYVFLTPCGDGCDWKGVAYGPDFVNQLEGHKPRLPTKEEVALAVLSNRVLYKGPAVNATVSPLYTGPGVRHSWMDTERGGEKHGSNT